MFPDRQVGRDFSPKDHRLVKNYYLRGPGLFNWDFGLTREFAMTSGVKLQFRAEAFNFTNAPHLPNPDNNVGDGEDFMSITSVQDLGREGIDERQFRFGLRVVL